LKAKSVTPSPQSTTTASPAPVPVAKKKKDFLKKVVSAVNKVNPATVLLRNGILSAMKLNIKNVAARLRWSYLTPQQAAAKNIDAVKFQKLIATRQKLEKIFQGAGGKIDNLKKAILGGKGNKDKAVSGLGMLPMNESINYINEYTPLDQLLGNEIYYSENVDGMEGFRGFGELGEPVTLATVGAAMGVIAGIVAALKQIGDIFKSKTKGSEDFDEIKTGAPENSVSATANDSIIPPVATNPILPEQDSSTSFKESSLTPDDTYTDETLSPAKSIISQSTGKTNMVLVSDELEKSSVPAAETSAPDNSGPEKENFWDKNKKWLKPVAIGVGGLAIVAIGYKMLKTDKALNKSSPSLSGLSGVPYKKKKKKNHHRKFKLHHKKAVALL